MHTWKSGAASWKMNGATYISVPFTWDIPNAIIMANQKKLSKQKVFIGGPAVFLMEDYVRGRVKKNVEVMLEGIEGIEPVTAHNPWATFTSRGCISKCRFCAVPRIEGTFRDIEDFIPRPIVCDNNFLAKSKKQFKLAVEKLSKLPFVDFNQGLDATIFTPNKATIMQSLHIPNIRFSFDSMKKEAPVVDAINLARKKGFKRISIYVLYGFVHSIDESVAMAELMREHKVGVYPMRYQPLDTLVRNSFVDKDNGWTDDLLKAFQRCFFSTNIPFNEFTNKVSLIDSEGGFGFC